MANKTRKHNKKGGMKKPGFTLDIGRINEDIEELQKELKRKTPQEIIQKRIAEQTEGIKMRNERIQTGKTRSTNPFRVGQTKPPSPSRKYHKRPSMVRSHSRKSRDSNGSKTRSATRTH